MSFLKGIQIVLHNLGAFFFASVAKSIEFWDEHLCFYEPALNYQPWIVSGKYRQLAYSGCLSTFT